MGRLPGQGFLEESREDLLLSIRRHRIEVRIPPQLSGGLDLTRALLHHQAQRLTTLRIAR